MSYLRPRFSALFLRVAPAALIVGYAIAQPVAARIQPPVVASQVAEQSRFIGVWQLDLTRMPATYGPFPKKVTYSFEYIGSGKWRTKIDITAPDDSVRRIAIEYRRDGQVVRGEGDDADGDIAAFNSAAPNVLVMCMAKNQELAGVRVYTISGDRKEMTEAAAGVDDKGASFVRNFYFIRVG